MTSGPDKYYIAMKDFQEINQVIKKEIVNLRSTTINITTTAMKLEKRITEFKQKVIKYQDAYLTKAPEAYDHAITNKENIIRINKLEAYITQCNKYLDEVNEINSSKFKYSKHPDDYVEPKEVQMLSKSDYLLYQQRRLHNQDELIESMINVATENNKIGRQMTNVMSDQIVEITKIDKDLETANNRVKKTNKRFEDYIELASYWKFYAIIIIQLFIIIFLLMF